MNGYHIDALEDEALKPFRGTQRMDFGRCVALKAMKEAAANPKQRVRLQKEAIIIPAFSRYIALIPRNAS